MAKCIYNKALLTLTIFIFMVLPAQLQATICQLCHKLEACEITINRNPNYIWQVATASFSPTSPFTTLIEGIIESKNHELCQCCLSLCLAKNWNPETNCWKKDKCPVCHQEERCPMRPNLRKIQMVCPGDPISEQKLFCPDADDKPKILIIGNQRQLPAIIPEGLMSQEQSPSKLELRKDLVLGVVFFTDNPIQIDSTIQAMILFGDRRVEDDLKGFYNSAVVIIDQKTGLPISYAFSAPSGSKESFEYGKLPIFSLPKKKRGVFYLKMIVIIEKPLEIQ